MSKRNLTVSSAAEYLKKMGFEVDMSRKLLCMPSSPAFGIHTLGVMDFLVLEAPGRNHGFHLVNEIPKIKLDKLESAKIGVSKGTPVKGVGIAEKNI